MRQHHGRQSWRAVAIALIMATLTASIIEGCGQVNDSSDSQHSLVAPTSLPESVPTRVEPTPTPNSKELFVAHWQATVAAGRTAFALSGTPTWTPGGAPIAGPSPTPWLGLQTCGNANTRDPYYISCWEGFENDHLIGLASGREGLDGDMTQGLVSVFDNTTHLTQHFRTPDKVGGVRITAVDGTLFTVTTVDHSPAITYIFDLATQQWVTPTPRSVPSVSVSPESTSSPVPTPGP